jgi:hypothetical protein
MAEEVYANGNEIAAKSDLNKVTAAFPDVCLSPPSPPAGPIPLPYPNTAFSSDLKEGSVSVLLGGKPAALAQQSYYQPSALGDEAATKSFGMNIITHQITGKTYFQVWSLDVMIEGKNVCRHLDLTTSNHASQPPGNPTPTPGLSKLFTVIPPGQFLKPPGDCTQAQSDSLTADVDAAKAERDKAGGKCQGGDTPAMAQAKGRAWNKLYIARARRETLCYRGGDMGHQMQMSDCMGHVVRCSRIAAGLPPF